MLLAVLAVHGVKHSMLNPETGAKRSVLGRGASLVTNPLTRSKPLAPGHAGDTGRAPPCALTLDLNLGAATDNATPFPCNGAKSEEIVRAAIAAALGCVAMSSSSMSDTVPCAAEAEVTANEDGDEDEEDEENMPFASPTCCVHGGAGAVNVAGHTPRIDGVGNDLVGRVFAHAFATARGRMSAQARIAAADAASGSLTSSIAELRTRFTELRSRLDTHHRAVFPLMFVDVGCMSGDGASPNSNVQEGTSPPGTTVTFPDFVPGPFGLPGTPPPKPPRRHRRRQLTCEALAASLVAGAISRACSLGAAMRLVNKTCSRCLSHAQDETCPFHNLMDMGEKRFACCGLGCVPACLPLLVFGGAR